MITKIFKTLENLIRVIEVHWTILPSNDATVIILFLTQCSETLGGRGTG
jgi:hypothetical protein